jgi:hypothetical protein
MLIVKNLKTVDLLKQNCRVKRTYKKCDDFKLCNPQAEFGMIENCKTCTKQL